MLQCFKNEAFMNLLAELSTVSDLTTPWSAFRVATGENAVSGQSINLANLSFLSLFISMIFYWVGTSFKDFKMVSFTFGVASVAEGEPLGLSLPQSGKADRYAVPQSGLKGQHGSFSAFAYKFGQYGILFSNIVLGLLLALRWKESGHFPLSNLYESLMFLSWCFTGIHLLIEKSQETTKGGMSQTLVGALTTPSALLTNAFATFTLPKEMQESSPLVPALQSNWLMMHVTVMIISYAALIIGSLLSIAFLIITFEGSNNEMKKPSNLSNLNGLNGNATTDLTNNLKPGTNNKLSNIALLLDNLSYRILGIGFPFLTIGILSGAVWANEAWGSYWSWDPKETWALLTWLIFAIYLHTRLSKGWDGKKPAIIASFGFVIVWICYLGVNLLGEGLHSYGWIST
jgi:cytochrome c-type biogenesis protein CcsB